MAYEETAPITNQVPDDVDPPTAEPVEAKQDDEKVVSEERKAHVNKILRKIRSDKKYHEKAFKQMKRDMFFAMKGREENWSENNYKANIAGRHVKQKTATLYAKNPKVTARRAERMDFAVWDEDPQSIMQAMMALQQDAVMAQAHAERQQMAMTAIQHDPVAQGMAQIGVLAAVDPVFQPYQPSPEAMQAQAVLDDFQQGMERKKLIARVGKTLEILFSQAMREQMPVDFKMAAKQLVRRTSTTGVGYVELGFQREYGPRPGLTDHLADARVRLDHLRKLSEEIQEGEIESTDAEVAELEASIASLQSEPEILIREGLVFDFPRSTKVIPDQMTKTLVGFVGSRHLTIEYEYTAKEVEELFDGVDLRRCANYTADGKAFDTVAGINYDEDGNRTYTEKGEGLVRVWKHYDKPSGLVYYVADGYDDFLREPAAPDVFVESFWPVYALTFNEVESENELFPPSDVYLLRDMGNEVNRSRQGKREHREAARPRWFYPNGAVDEEDVARVSKVKPFDAIGLNMDPNTDLSKVFQAMPVPGVDPNLYDVNEVITDAQMVVGAQEAQLGATSNSTATEAAIAAGAANTTDSASVDDLDSFMTVLARAGGQILLREMSEETVKLKVGPGAVWPHMSLADIADELFLEVEAGSMGKPNQAVEVKNWKEMLPLLIQMGGIKPLWLARETLRRLDDKMDLTEATAEGIPSIAALNQVKQPAAVGAEQDPAAQGGKGGNNAKKGPPETQPGSEAPIGNNQG